MEGGDRLVTYKKPHLLCGHPTSKRWILNIKCLNREDKNLNSQRIQENIHLCVEIP